MLIFGLIDRLMVDFSLQRLAFSLGLWLLNHPGAGEVAILAAERIHRGCGVDGKHHRVTFQLAQERIVPGVTQREYFGAAVLSGFKQCPAGG